MHKTRHSPKVISYFSYSSNILSLNYTVPFIQCCQDVFKTAVSPTQLSKQKKHCAMMLSTNLAALKWVTVECNTKRNVDVVCMINFNASHSANISSTGPSKKCLSASILKGDFCYKFIYYDHNNTISIKPIKYFLALNSLENIKFLILAFETKIHPILSADTNSNYIKEFSYYTYYNTLKFSTKLRSKSLVKGYFVQRHLSVSTIILELSSNLLKCQNNVIISNSFLCDDVMDCGDNDMSDEKGCQCNNVIESNFRKCKIIIQEKRKSACTFLFSLSYGCELNHLSYSAIVKNKNLFEETLHCFNRKLPNSQLIDKLDLGREDDETFLSNIYRNLTRYGCPSSNLIPCRRGHSCEGLKSHLSPFPD